ncbi:phage integrase family domain protein [Mycobacterium sp. MAC_080597_8934]|uniref:hypothetical protein n=1 Tax=Mycobacterium sp. MAC_080597_8934 TaxID=1335322 RepID=UPI00044F8866|nr:hypothetical protein [Mycobacterium sp. MAC_080597_8934]ETZ59708.1 phage integrase family domain protein [Mycobacterium sp. MAC_080597_8934]
MPLICHTIGTGRLRLDVELAAVKQLTGWAAQWRTGSERIRRVAECGNSVGLEEFLVETVLGECLAVVLAHHGGMVADLTGDALDDFDAALSRTVVPPSSRRHTGALASLRQLLFETAVIDTAPKRRRWARSLEQRFTEVEMPDPIRQTLLRYIGVRAACCGPNRSSR